MLILIRFNNVMLNIRLNTNNFINLFNRNLLNMHLQNSDTDKYIKFFIKEILFILRITFRADFNHD